MSNKTNFRRKRGKRTETGPAFESRTPSAGCNSTHVARSRRAWKRLAARTERRNGNVSPKFHSMSRFGRRPAPRPEE